MGVAFPGVGVETGSGVAKGLVCLVDFTDPRPPARALPLILRGEGSVIPFLAGVASARASFSLGLGVGLNTNRLEAAAADASGVGIGRPAVPNRLSETPTEESAGGDENPRGRTLAVDNGDARRVGNDNREGVSELYPPPLGSGFDIAVIAADGDGWLRKLSFSSISFRLLSKAAS